jgi:hypothetical protein
VRACPRTSEEARNIAKPASVASAARRDRHAIVTGC